MRINSGLELGVAMRVLLVENIHPNAKEILEKNGFQVEMQRNALSEAELLQCLPSYDIIGIRSKTKISSEVLVKNPHLQAIGCFCIGTDQVDLQTAREMNIPVFNAPTANTRSVVEWVLGQMLSLARDLYGQNQKLHNGVWSKTAEGRFEIRDKTLAIIGYGNIGSSLSVIAEFLGMRVVFYDIERKVPHGKAEAKSSLKEALQEADFVSLHVPETPLTRNMLQQEQLRWMKKGSYLLNSSRGAVVHLEDLAEVLDEGVIAGCALDVFPVEPSASHADFHCAVRGLKNVMLTSHIGGSTEQAQKAVSFEVVDNLLRYLKLKNL